MTLHLCVMPAHGGATIHIQPQHSHTDVTLAQW